MIENPFSIIDRRLTKIELLLLEIRSQATGAPPTKKKRINPKPKEVSAISEKEVSNG